MAALLVRACTKQRKMLGVRMDRSPVTGFGHELWIQFFRTTPISMKKRKTAEERKHKALIMFAPKPKAKPNVPVVDVWRNMTVKELVDSSKRPLDQVLDVLAYVANGEFTKNTVLDPMVVYQAVKTLGAKYRVVPKPRARVEEEKDNDVEPQPPPDPSMVIKRRPVVTVMGHVDHGKTTLLDSLRNTSVVDSEFGGITQHIGAFNVTLSSGEAITFLDTPGHAAFTTMRERGANATDIVILVVAADDGVMEQTVESIRMAKEANVPIIVAINKIDKPSADIERTRKMLAQQGILVEDLGGDVQSIPISALHGTNLSTLVEAVVAQAEIMNLRGDPNGLVEGVVIEASVDTARGKLATILVRRGTLRKGSVLVSGLAWAKVRAMFDHAGTLLTEAGVSEAVRIIGWRSLPDAGDTILEVESERKAHSVIRFREGKKAEQDMLEQSKAVAEKRAVYEKEYQAQLAKKRTITRYKRRPVGPRPKEIPEDDGVPKVNIVVKADVVGSVEAILDVFGTYGEDELCRLNVVHYGVGAVTENDVEIAKAFNAIVYCFNIPPSAKAAEEAAKQAVEIRKFRVIYKLVDDLKAEIARNLPFVTKEKILGKANVLQLFVVTEGKKKWNVAGSRCTQGVLKKSALFRLERENEIIYEGKLASMRHLKNEVDTIKNDVECGLRFADPQVALQPGDTLICFENYEEKSESHWDPGF